MPCELPSRAVLLTGATGLLGSYLLAAFLRRRMPVAVLARGDSQGTAWQRIEAVVRRFEGNQYLSRPRIIQGDLGAANCGVSHEDQAWLRSQPIDILHSAASIRFQECDDSGEPYRTNVQGMQNLLELSRSLQAVNFHYVSTAYVGNALAGRVLESPINAVSSARNDYERSKILAEQLLREESGFQQKLIHRPSIIVGDSSTGFTSTYHGFYSPLQLGFQLAQRLGFWERGAAWLREELGLQGDDKKNLVHVDWVAECIAQILCDRRSADHEQGPINEPVIYHWTNPRPTPVQWMQNAIGDSLEARFNSRRSETETSADKAVDVANQFRKQLMTYEAYFSGDPEFDNKRAQSALPNLPCPIVDYSKLRTLCDFALDHGFGWPRPKLPENPTHRVVTQLHKYMLASGPAEEPGFGALERTAAETIRLELLGPNSPPPMILQATMGELGTVQQQTQGREGSTATVSMALTTLINCASRKVGLIELIRRGDVVISGVLSEQMLSRLQSWVAKLCS